MIRIELTFRNLILFFGFLILAWLSYLVRGTIVLLGIALMLMAALHPLVKRAEERGFSRRWAVALAMLLLVLVPLLIIVAISPLVINEVQAFAKDFPAVQKQVDELLGRLGMVDRVNEAIQKANLQDRLAELAVVSAQQIVSIVVQTVTVIVVSGYLLADRTRLQLMLHEFVPHEAERHIEPLLQGMERVVGGYIRGQLLTSAMFGIFATVLCLVLGVPDPLLLGVVAAIGDVIPIFGIPSAMLVAVLVALTHSLWQPLGVIAGYGVYWMVENQLLVPRIYSRTVNLSPLAVIVATIAGGALDGVVGILLAIPIVGALKFILDYAVAERLAARQRATEAQGIAQPELLRTEAHKTEAELREPGVPQPTYSPFEPVPEPGSTMARKVSGARYLTLAHLGARRKRQDREPAVTVRRRRRE